MIIFKSGLEHLFQSSEDNPGIYSSWYIFLLQPFKLALYIRRINFNVQDLDFFIHI